MRKLSLFVAALVLLSSSLNVFAWEHPQSSEQSPSEMTMMSMADHCDHEEESSVTQDCINHCAMLVALLINPTQENSILIQSFDLESITGSPLSRISAHWRPPSQTS